MPADVGIEINSVDGNLVTNPIYNLRLLYNGVKNISLKVINRDYIDPVFQGNILYEGEIWFMEGDYNSGVEDFVLNLDNLGGYGNFTFEVTAMDSNGVPVENAFFMMYRKSKNNIVDGGYIEADSEDGEAEVDMNVDIDANMVVTIRTEIYDPNGELARVVIADMETGDVHVCDKDENLIFTIPNGAKKDDEKLKIPFGGLEYGEYVANVFYLNQDGEPVGDIYKYTVGYFSGSSVPVPVPDTGSFLKSLNISREDYLITGALVFVVIGIAAFIVVKRKV